MSVLPIISIKSKQLQADLGVRTVRSARRKICEFGVQLIDGEYVSIRELERVMEAKLQSTQPVGPSVNWLSGSSFEGMGG